MTFNCFKCGSGSIQRGVVSNTSADTLSLPARDAARTLRRMREHNNQIEQNSNQYVNALAEALDPNTTATANSNAPVQRGPVADNSDVIDRLMFFSGCSLPAGFGWKDLKETVARGEQLVSDLLTEGKSVEPATINDMQDISWYIMAKAAEKDLDDFKLRSFKGPDGWQQGRVGNVTAEGMYRFQDPGGRIHAFLSPLAPTADDRYFPTLADTGKQHCYENKDNSIVLPGKGGAVWLGALKASVAGGNPEMFVKFKQAKRSTKVLARDTLKDVLGELTAKGYLDETTHDVILNAMEDSGEAGVKRAAKLLEQALRHARATADPAAPILAKYSEEEFEELINDIGPMLAKDEESVIDPIHPPLLRRKEDMHKSGMNVFLNEHFVNFGDKFVPDIEALQNLKSGANPDFATALDTIMAAIQSCQDAINGGDFTDLQESLNALLRAFSDSPNVDENWSTLKADRLNDIARFKATTDRLELSFGDKAGMRRRGMEVLLDLAPSSKTRMAGVDLSAQDYADAVVVPGKTGPATNEINMKKEGLTRLDKNTLSILDVSGYRVVVSKARFHDELVDAPDALALGLTCHPPEALSKKLDPNLSAAEVGRELENIYSDSGAVCTHAASEFEKKYTGSPDAAAKAKEDAIQTLHHEIAHVVNMVRGRRRADRTMLSQLDQDFIAAFDKDVDELSSYERNDLTGDEAFAESRSRHINNYASRLYKTTKDEVITKKRTASLADYHANPDTDPTQPTNPMGRRTNEV